MTDSGGTCVCKNEIDKLCTNDLEYGLCLISMSSCSMNYNH